MCRRRVYPRVCGGTSANARLVSSSPGLSPRVRGNLPLEMRHLRWPGSIPACAGEPGSASARNHSRRVYPRVCGGTKCPSAGLPRRPGLSPRVRGNPIGDQAPRVSTGSIPACAGEPAVDQPRLDLHGVYPRVCGGTTRCRESRSRQWGLSPRVRGNRQCPQALQGACGSIPACAGEPARAWRLGREGRVYPRVCGGTFAPDVSAAFNGGLSPRVRGNRREVVEQHARGGSIPACAGEPGAKTERYDVLWVYPRVCGGTAPSTSRTDGFPGLSPRVRGNLIDHSNRISAIGSIPACAGEPRSGAQRTPLCRVYPRVCGGTDVRASVAARVLGLSPRVRGNPVTDPLPHARQGSIPACAGEPDGSAIVLLQGGVYPRVCGGTRVPASGLSAWRGLSPRVRGNRRTRAHMGAESGSIPACAGEPSTSVHADAGIRVYPRVCGGTSSTVRVQELAPGLSPRVRGNLENLLGLVAFPGSIPACAGEPPPECPPRAMCRVYPRVCGGTAQFVGWHQMHGGLSPRVRGNRHSDGHGLMLCGSIPACAGEPPDPRPR